MDAGTPVYEQDNPAYMPNERAFERVKLAAKLGRVMMIDVAPDETATLPAQRRVAGGVVVELGGVATAGVYRIVQGERVLRTVAVNEDARESDPTACVTTSTSAPASRSQMSASILA